jgi:hypothetical protein
MSEKTITPDGNEVQEVAEKPEAKAKPRGRPKKPAGPPREYLFVKIRRDQSSAIWDPKKNRLVVQFDKSGCFKTTDSDIAKMLQELGYYLVPKGHRPMPTPMAEPPALLYEE